VLARLNCMAVLTGAIRKCVDLSWVANGMECIKAGLNATY